MGGVHTLSSTNKKIDFRKNACCLMETSRDWKVWRWTVFRWISDLRSTVLVKRQWIQSVFCDPTCFRLDESRNLFRRQNKRSFWSTTMVTGFLLGIFIRKWELHEKVKSNKWREKCWLARWVIQCGLRRCRSREKTDVRTLSEIDFFSLGFAIEGGRRWRTNGLIEI